MDLEGGVAMAVMGPREKGANQAGRDSKQYKERGHGFEGGQEEKEGKT